MAPKRTAPPSVAIKVHTETVRLIEQIAGQQQRSRIDMLDILVRGGEMWIAHVDPLGMAPSRPVKIQKK